MRRDLGGAGHRDDLDGDACALEEGACELWECRRDTRAGWDVGHASDVTIFGDGDREPAAAELEIEKTIDVALGFGDEIPSGDAKLRRAVGDELRNVLGADEDRLEDVAAPQRGGERAVT